MQLSLMENGMDSLKKGFEYFLTYQRNTVTKNSPDKKDYFELKQAILSVHHGIEILLKAILARKDESLIVDKIDDDYLRAFAEKEKTGKSSIFDTSLGENIHTITYEEALHRVDIISEVKLPSVLVEKLKQLNKVRNCLTHASINIPDKQINGIFMGLFNELDILFIKAFGQDYKSVSGYSTLLENYDKYMELLKKSGAEDKRSALAVFTSAFKKAGISIGEDEVAYIDNITQAKKFFKEINSDQNKKYDIFFGMDMYDYCCSGRCFVRIIDESHLGLVTTDNKSIFIFKFKSMSILFPIVTSNRSPVIIFECDDDSSFNDKYLNSISEDSFGCKTLEGLKFIENGKDQVTYDDKEIEEFYYHMEYDDTFVIPDYYSVRAYLSKKVFACLNVQGLGFWDFKSFLSNFNRAGITGEKVAIWLREGFTEKGRKRNEKK